MQVFEIKTNLSDYPYLVVAGDFKRAVEIMNSKGVFDRDIVSVVQLEEYTESHILLDELLTEKGRLEQEVRMELAKTMPRWMPEHNGAAGGCERERYLIRTSKGCYFMSKCIGGPHHYLLLEDLEQLPGLPEEG